MALRDLCKQYGIRFKKSLGQNLLLDDNINRIMVEAADLSTADYVVEVGPGLGALTDHIYKQSGELLAVEIDRSFMPCLEDRFSTVPNIHLFRGDVLNHSLDNLVEDFIPGGKSHKMISNLPYYITTPLLFHFWESPLFFSRMVVMVQEEVGLRMTAPVGTRDYGALALKVQYYSDVDIVRKVPRTCFRPEPKVDSCIVRFRNRDPLPYADVRTASLSEVIKAAFNQRRKTLLNSLSRQKVFGLSKEQLVHILETVEITPTRRPQTLTLDEFANLSREIQRVAGL